MQGVLDTLQEGGVTADSLESVDFEGDADSYQQLADTVREALQEAENPAQGGWKSPPNELKWGRDLLAAIEAKAPAPKKDEPEESGRDKLARHVRVAIEDRVQLDNKKLFAMAREDTGAPRAKGRLRLRMPTTPQNSG